MPDVEVVKRIMPHNIEAEQAVIGAMLMNNEVIARAADKLTKEDFYQKSYGIMFATIVDLMNNTGNVDIVVLGAKLKEQGIPEEMTSYDALLQIMEKATNSSVIDEYCQIVEENALLRNVITANEQIANSCYSGKESTDVIMEDVEKKIFNLVQKRSLAESKTIADIARETLERIEKASRTKGAVTGIPTGFVDLDYKLAGLQNSDLVLIAARPAMGKTAFVLNIAQHVALKENKTVALFSLEMSDVQLATRLFSLESRVNSNKLRTGDLTDDEWTNIVDAASSLGSSKLLIDASPGISINEMRSKCRKYKMEHDLSLVIVDYLQLMTGNRRGSDSRQQEISDISRGLKVMAKELDVPVIALSQLSRAVESRPDKRPMLSDLRESGAIEQDADVVMFIYRDDYYNKENSPEPGVAEIDIAKQRSGPTGKIKLAWLPDYTKFANLEMKPQRYEEE